jgi:hypothetical protein
MHHAARIAMLVALPFLPRPMHSFQHDDAHVFKCVGALDLSVAP